MAVCDYEYDGDTGKLKVNCLGCLFGASIEDYDTCMARVMDKILEVKKVSTIVLAKEREYEYDQEQTNLLVEVARIIEEIVRERVISPSGLGKECERHFPEWSSRLQFLVINLLRRDPIGAYAELLRDIRKANIGIRRAATRQEQSCLRKYRDGMLLVLKAKMEGAKLIGMAKPHIAGYRLGDRSLYRQIFSPSVRPNFMLTRYMITPPERAKSLERYRIGDVSVEIFKVMDTTEHIYYITPPEFRLSEEKYTVLDAARRYMAAHRPKTAEFVKSERVREVFYNIGRDMIREVADSLGVHLTTPELDQLAQILTRYTAGMGVLELLMSDERIQDIYVNSPIERSPIRIFHSDYEECSTNLIPTREDAESWATRLRIQSGRPLDEANPVLDTDLGIPGGRARFCVITRTLSPQGLAFAIRRHRDKPWTLPLFIKAGMLDPLAAGLLSFLIDGAASILIAGGRSSGKCLEGSELVQLSSGKLKEIESLVEDTFSKNRVLKCSDGYYSFTDDIEILTLDDRLKIKPAKVSCVWKRRAHPQNLVVKTRSGRTITCTPEHPFFILKGLDTIEKRADEIGTGCRIASVKSLPILPEEISLPKFINPKRGMKIKTPDKISGDLMEILGYLYGDGHVSIRWNKHVGFTNNNRILQKRFIRLTEKLFGIKAKTRIDKRNGVVTSFAYSSSLVKYLELLGFPMGRKADRIKLPDFILSSDNKHILALIRAVFDCDSSVRKDARDIEFSTASHTFAKQIQSLLNRFGIISILSKKIIKRKPYYRVFLRGSEISKYMNEIGFRHPQKRNLLHYINMKTRYDNTNIDSIPIGGHVIRKLRRLLGIQNGRELRERIKTNILNLENENWLPSRNKLRMIAEIFSKKYEAIRHYEQFIGEAKLFLEFTKNRETVIESLNKLIENLSISFSQIAEASGTSRENIRKYLKDERKRQNPAVLIEILRAVAELSASRIKEIKYLNSLAPKICNFSEYIKNSALTYTETSRATQIPETSIKSYSYQGIMPPDERAFRLEQVLTNTSSQCKNVYQSLSNALSYIGQFRDINTKDIWRKALEFIRLLNIKSLEISKKSNLNLNMISFYRNGLCLPSVKSMESILEQIVNRFERINGEGDSIKKLTSLADSDIFWDEIVSVSKVKPKDKWVYDLTVDKTHNFITNGLVAHNTSLLASLMLEMLPQTRQVLLEDTLELPAESLVELKYNIQRLKSRSVITMIETEMAADEALRTALRLGDSALIVGEIRSKEAKALYEAMRIGALSNVVAGTIHGESPYGVYDRVVNDLGVPPTSFKATDILPICKMLRSADGLHRFRRMTEITEVRKEWEENPIKEGGFVPLMVYSARDDKLKPTDTLVNGESEVLNRIASYVKEWAGNWEALWGNIKLRARIKQAMVELSEKAGRPDLLEADWVTRSNSRYHLIAEEVRRETGGLDPERVYLEWLKWFKLAARIG